jgi:sporulation and spore germination protein
MTPRAAAAIGAGAIVIALLAVLAIVGPARARRTPSPAASTPAPAPATAARKIKARLFYVSADGMGLTSVERDVPFADGIDQAREIVSAQIAPVADPLLSAIPPGTALRDLFITDTGAAYVDLSREAASAHWGGTLAEMLTVYTIVDALTVNLPAVHAVQILVEGHEVPTLAGHVDLRQPLAQNLGLVQ